MDWVIVFTWSKLNLFSEDVESYNGEELKTEHEDLGNIDGNFVCFECSKVFPDKKKLRSHISSHRWVHLF